jgi:hypothetical protein
MIEKDIDKKKVNLFKKFRLQAAQKGDEGHRVELSEFMFTVIKKIDPSIEAVTDPHRH